MWFSRIKIFFNERYFPLPYLFAAFCTSWAMANLYKVYFHEDVSFVLILLCTFNTFSFPLVMRVCDEFKDLESDKLHFPERCIPRGDVLIEDVIKLGFLFIGLFIFLNTLILISLNKNFYLLIALLIYLYGFLKYFFFPKQVAENLILALVVSNPITLLLTFFNIYLISGVKGSLFDKGNVFLALLFWIPSWIWEIGRKIKISEDETTYQTYSRFLGRKLASIIPCIGLILMCLLLNTFLDHTNKKAIIQFFMVIVVFVYCLFKIRFIFKPSREQAQKIQPLIEIILMIFTLLELVIGYL